MICRRLKVFLIAITTVITPVAVAGVEVGDYTRTDFSPTRGESMVIPVKLDQESKVSLALYSPDHTVVRVIESQGSLPAGIHSLSWDGKDQDGDLVPDEAYVPVVTATTKDNEQFVYDPRDSGGEVDQVTYSVSEQGDIIYSLARPGRVLVRLGVKAGPMLRSLLHWEPRPAGRNILRWNGFDTNRLIDIRKHPKLSVLVTAFNLPDRAVIAYGNETEDYRTYSQRKNIPARFVEPNDRALARGDRRISVHHYLSRLVDVDPRVDVEFIKPDTTSTASLGSGEDFEVKVDIHMADQWAMAQNLFEVAFFIDDEFVAEEEHGYVPINWRYKPTSLAPGRHRLTVNISGFVGQVGVASIEFEIKK